MTGQLVQTVIGVGFFEFRSLFYCLDVPEVVVRIRQISNTQIARCDSRIRQAADNSGGFGARAEPVPALAPNTFRLNGSCAMLNYQNNLLHTGYMA